MARRWMASAVLGNGKELAPLTLLVGAALVLACVLRLGIVANFISEPVLVGFRAGIGQVIVIEQLPKVFGIHFARGTFFQNLIAMAEVAMDE